MGHFFRGWPTTFALVEETSGNHFLKKQSSSRFALLGERCVLWVERERVEASLRQGLPCEGVLATVHQAMKPRLREGKEANHPGLETYLVAGPEL